MSATDWDAPLPDGWNAGPSEGLMSALDAAADDVDRAEQELHRAKRARAAAIRRAVAAGEEVTRVATRARVTRPTVYKVLQDEAAEWDAPLPDGCNAPIR